MADSHPLDLLFLDPQRGGAYVASEMVIGAAWSGLLALPALATLWKYEDLCWGYDYWLSLWLGMSAVLRICDMPIKIYLWNAVRSLIDTSEDRRFTTRKLMQLVRGKGFFCLSRISIASYLVLGSGIIRVWWQTATEFPTIYHLCLVLICFSILKVMFSVLRFYSELAEAQRRHPADASSFLLTGATLEQIADLPVLTVTSALQANGTSLSGQSCAICIEEFSPGAKVKALRCSPTHVFHESCIDRWLIEMEACPLCTADLHKKND